MQGHVHRCYLLLHSRFARLDRSSPGVVSQRGRARALISSVPVALLPLPMSLFPALRNGNGAAHSHQQTSQPSAARASVMQAQQQQQQQQPWPKSSEPLPRLSPSARDASDAPASSTTTAASAVPSAFRKTHRAASPSFVAFATPATSGATTTNSLRITDARMHWASATQAGQQAQATSDPSSLWKQCKLDALNDFLATPGLSVAERALNGSKIRGATATDAAIAAAATRAHQALDVSKLEGVQHFSCSFGVNELGGGARILFLQIENTPVGGTGAAGAGSPSDDSNPETTVTSPLTVAPGTLSWRIRLPTELDVPLEHWATGGNGSGDDEQRYHEALADRQLFSVRPRKGTLAPGQTATIEIIYFPRFIGAHVCPILFQSRGAKHFTIVARAETVERMPTVFSMDHCRESFPAPAAAAASRTGSKKAEESKESTALVPVATSSPFLPSPFPIAYSYRLHDVPLGLSAQDTPLQTLALFNHSGRDLRYRVALDSLEALARENHGVRVLELQGDRVQDSTSGEVFLEGLVRAGRTGLLRLAFRPLETKEYRCTLRVLVQPDGGGEDREQSVTIEAKGVHPMEWAITPFPSLSTLPRAQTLLLPGQLASLSEDVVEFGDLPCFARATRVVSLRNLCESERLEFAFRHAIRPAAHKRTRTLDVDRRVRTLITTGQSSIADDDDDADEDLDAFESLHVACFPARGSLEPGESIQMRIDLNAGSQAIIMERDVAVDVWVAAEDQARAGGGGGGGAPSHSLDHFGFKRTPSAALANRPPVSSSTPAPAKLRSVHTEPRGGRAVHSLVGVGSGFAGADVRVDYPPKEPLPLGVATLARRTAAMKLGQSNADLHAAHTQSATAHLGPTLAHLASVPARATWFADATAPIREMSQATYNRLSILLRATVLSFAVLEREATARREAYGASQGPSHRLPQQTLTEILNPLSTVQQQFFIPPVEDAEGQAQRSTGQEESQQQQQQRAPVDATAASVVEAALLDLLKQSIADTTGLGNIHAHTGVTHRPIAISRLSFLTLSPFAAICVFPCCSGRVIPSSSSSARSVLHGADGGGGGRWCDDIASCSCSIIIPIVVCALSCEHVRVVPTLVASDSFGDAVQVDCRGHAAPTKRIPHRTGPEAVCAAAGATACVVKALGHFCSIVLSYKLTLAFDMYSCPFRSEMPRSRRIICKLKRHRPQQSFREI